MDFDSESKFFDRGTKKWGDCDWEEEIGADSDGTWWQQEERLPPRWSGRRDHAQKVVIANNSKLVREIGLHELF